jgi:hypothetical protein
MRLKKRLKNVIKKERKPSRMARKTG